jgi:hypothetical protein
LGCGADWEVSVFCIYGLLLVVERYSFLWNNVGIGVMVIEYLSLTMIVFA